MSVPAVVAVELFDTIDRLVDDARDRLLRVAGLDGTPDGLSEDLTDLVVELEATIVRRVRPYAGDFELALEAQAADLAQQRDTLHRFLALSDATSRPPVAPDPSSEPTGESPAVSPHAATQVWNAVTPHNEVDETGYVAPEALIRQIENRKGGE